MRGVLAATTRASARSDKDERHKQVLAALEGIRTAIEAQGKASQEMLHQLCRMAMKNRSKVEDLLDDQAEALDKLDVLLKKRPAPPPTAVEPSPPKRPAITDEEDKAKILAERFFGHIGMEDGEQEFIE